MTYDIILGNKPDVKATVEAVIPVVAKHEIVSSRNDELGSIVSATVVRDFCNGVGATGRQSFAI
ncbi:hypothetical protein D3C87_1847670 [compost metagenome]